MEKQFLIAGFGGQGVLLIGQLIAKTAMAEGKEVSWMPSYGPEMRGGEANCAVVVSDEGIGSPAGQRTRCSGRDERAEPSKIHAADAGGRIAIIQFLTD